MHAYRNIVPTARFQKYFFGSLRPRTINNQIIAEFNGTFSIEIGIKFMHSGHHGLDFACPPGKKVVISGISGKRFAASFSTQRTISAPRGGEVDGWINVAGKWKINKFATARKHQTSTSTEEFCGTEVSIFVVTHIVFAAVFCAGL